MASAVRACRAPLVTCEAVITEACYLLRDVPGASDAVLANVERGVFQVPFHIDASTRSVRTLMRRYASVPMDLADACLVAMADILGTPLIFTLDGDFGVYRWRRNRVFEFAVGK